MAQKLNSMPNYTARFPKESHDMSQSIAFTLATGMEVPVYYDVVHPGDSYHFRCKLFARLNPLVKPAMADIDFHLDYFFVPLQVLYTPASSLFWDTDDLISSRIDKSQLKEHFPLLSINGTVAALQAAEQQDAQGVNIPWQSTVSSFYPSTDFDCRGKASYRLLDMLGYNPDGILADYTQQILAASQMNPTVFPDKLAAYHAIHELYPGFRDSDREPKSYCYQLDTYYASQSFTDARLLELRYSYAYKDYFTSVKVSPIASSVSMLTLKDDSGNNVSPQVYLKRINNYLDSSIPYTNDASKTFVGAPLGDSSQISVDGKMNLGSPMVTTGMIRSMFAVEKLLRVIGRNEKNYESQVLAHFGFKSPHDPFHNITHIGHDMGTLRPSAVVSQADTFVDNGDGTGQGAALGEIGGQGVIAFSGQKKNFVAPCHGVLMVILRAIPRYRYIGTFDKQNAITDRMSYVQPEYMDLGMQPLFAYEAFPGFIYQTAGDTIGNNGATRPGWQYNMEQYKRKYDRASRAFYIPYRSDQVNQYSPWVLSRKPWRANGLRNFASSPLKFYELLSTPKDLDDIMLLKYNTSWNTAYLTTPYMMFQYDPFICDFNCHCKKVNIMPEYGEPEL